MHHLAPINTRTAHLAAQRARKAAEQQRRMMRLASALVGLGILATGLLSAFQTHAATPTASATSAAQAQTGVVQSVQAVEVKGKGSGAGVVAGALLGGLVGNQMGRGTGNTVMTVGGAVAGGYAGNEVEKNAKKHTVYKTSVKLDDGSLHSYTESKAFAVGARVNVAGKHLQLAP